jgi:predicted glycosyltransferase
MSLSLKGAAGAPRRSLARRPGRRYVWPRKAASSSSVATAAKGADLVEHAIEAWQGLCREGGIGHRTLVIFAGLHWPSTLIQRLTERIRGEPSLLKPFRPDFTAWMRLADLPINQAGYNTGCDILASGVRAVVSAYPVMSDQGPRAAGCARRRRVECVPA